MSISFSIAFNYNFVIHVENFWVILKFWTAFSNKGVMREGLFEVWVKKLSGEVSVIALSFDMEEHGYFREGSEFSSFIRRDELTELFWRDVFDGCWHDKDMKLINYYKSLYQILVLI